MKTVLALLIVFLTTPTSEQHEPVPAMIDQCVEFNAPPDCAPLQLPNQQVFVCCDANACAVFWDSPQCRGDMCCGGLYDCP
jgi:hypothetical protein